VSTNNDNASGRKLLPFEEAAHRLGIGTTKLRELIAAGMVDTVRIGNKRRLVPIESVDAYADNLPRENNTATPGPARRGGNSTAKAATGARKR
jgi:excisionase family DNA binding protein